MKLLKVFSLLTFLVLFSCTSEETLVVVDAVEDDTTDVVDDDEDTTDDPVMEEENPSENTDVTFSLVEAFPQISLSQPLDLQTPDDGTNRIFVVERRGEIKVFLNEPSVAQAATFLNLNGSVSIGGEQGLLGLAFHPDYGSNGFFYVSYTSPDGASVISRFAVSANDVNQADNSSELVLLQIAQPFGNHNGGQITFGPDGYLYIAIGDGGSSGDPLSHGQNKASLLGSILRIDVNTSDGSLNYGTPTDNPFVNETSSRNEIYAFGLRNPWRMSFDTQTGKLWAGDVGQNKIEEIDIIESGGNYGWKLFEGNDCFSGDCNAAGLLAPVFQYNHDNGDVSITGGYVYRGSVNASLEGKYIYGDFASGRIWALALDGSTNELLLESNLNISSFGTDNAQELYICGYDGKIYTLEEN